MQSGCESLFSFGAVAADLFDPGVRGTVRTGVYPTVFDPEYALKSFRNVISTVLTAGHEFWAKRQLLIASPSATNIIFPIRKENRLERKYCEVFVFVGRMYMSE